MSRPDGSPTTAVDMAVYTRNRHFRCMMSCKAGKRGAVSLVPTTRFMGAGAKGQEGARAEVREVEGGLGDVCGSG